jgi:hypothetical protein
MEDDDLVPSKIQPVKDHDEPVMTFLDQELEDEYHSDNEGFYNEISQDEQDEPPPPVKRRLSKRNDARAAVPVYKRQHAHADSDDNEYISFQDIEDSSDQELPQAVIPPAKRKKATGKHSASTQRDTQLNSNADTCGRSNCWSALPLLIVSCCRFRHSIRYQDS